MAYGTIICYHASMTSYFHVLVFLVFTAKPISLQTFNKISAFLSIVLMIIIMIIIIIIIIIIITDNTII